MPKANILSSPDLFTAALYDKVKQINIGIEELELYEFGYALSNVCPRDGGWIAVTLDRQEAIEERINRRDFYLAIQLKPRVNGRIVLDENILHLTRMLCVGLVTGEYSPEWVDAHFYFDIRGFCFLHRTVYFTASVLAHLGGKPFKSFEQRQKRLERYQGIGYRDFAEANAEVDQLFVAGARTLIAARRTPILFGIAGPTAAGKTEIVERLRDLLEHGGARVGSIEMDNFLTDRDTREERGIDTLGKEALHFELLRRSLEAICQGQKITTPRYDFVVATSSHDMDGNLKPGCAPIEIEPADIVFVEGNFPFLLSEVAPLIGIKAVYLTDDAVRMKRKWKRDVDYRKKYEPNYFRNRFFREQFLMARECYVPQMEMCDMVVDTTGAAVWTTPEVADILNAGQDQGQS